MLPKVYRSLALAAGLLPLTAAAGPTESYDITNCSAAAVTTLSASAELTVLNIDGTGIARSNSSNDIFENATFRCTSVVKVAGTQRSGLGYCKFMSPDGDFFIGEQVFNSAGGGKWTFLQGTGKWKGISGGGEFVPLTSGKPIVAGTAQGCVRATGTYELSK